MSHMDCINLILFLQLRVDWIVEEEEKSVVTG